mgnify:CR=1 FL=1
MDRLALVIGNSDYTKVGKLNNPQNDANDIEKVLQKLNFDVTKLINATLNDIYQAVHFSSSIAAWTDPRGSGADIPDGEIPPKVLRALLCSISGCP